MITNLAGAVTLALFTFVSSISQKMTKLSSVALLAWQVNAYVVSNRHNSSLEIGLPTDVSERLSTLRL